MRLKLIMRYLQTVLSEHRVGVTSEDLSYGKRTNLKIDECFEPLRSLNVKRTIAVEAVFDHAHKLFEHFEKFLY
jgi:hypothetical protein